MQLTADWLPEFIRLTGAHLDSDQRAARLERLLARLATDPTLPTRMRILPRGASPASGAAAAVFAMPWYGETWQAHIHLDPDAPPELAQLAALLTEWEAGLAGLDPAPGALLCRLELPAPAPLEEALQNAGWSSVGGRVEFRTPVAELPPELDDSPFTWHALDDYGREAAAALFERAGAGPEWEESDDAAALIEGYLAEEGVYHEPDCIQIGTIAGEGAAFLCAQADREGGWCTITFLGIVPERRGQGLGTHVHRRGFAMLRDQGGRSYHGGTSADNAAMRRLFERHGCRPLRELREWRREPNPTPQP